MASTIERPRSPERRPTRRDLLTTAALAAVAATVATVPVAALAAEEPDPLPAAWRRLDANFARLDELRRRLDELLDTIVDGRPLSERTGPVFVPAGGRAFYSEEQIGEARWLTPAEAEDAKARLRRLVGRKEELERSTGLAGLRAAIYDLATENDALSERMATTPARTVAGVAVKIRCLHACAVHGSDGFEDDYLETALEDLERLAGKARHA